MDANHVMAGKATQEADIAKKKANQYVAKMFEDANDIPQLLGYLAGASSMLWSERPKGEFDGTKAKLLVDLAEARLNELVDEKVKAIIVDGLQEVKRRQVEAMTKDAAETVRNGGVTNGE